MSIMSKKNINDRKSGHNMKKGNVKDEFSLQDRKTFRRKINENMNKGKTTSMFKIIVISIFAFTIFGSMIYGNVELTSLLSEQKKLEEKLEEIEEENINYEFRLNQKITLRNVEEYAENNLKLKKLDKSQIEYIEIPKFEISESDNNKKPNIFVRIKRMITDFLE